MNHVIFSSWQIQAHQAGRLKAFVVPVEPQPLSGFSMKLGVSGIHYCAYLQCSDGAVQIQSRRWSPPFAIGSPLVVKETWSMNVEGDEIAATEPCYYKADDPRGIMIIQWYSPAIMPREVSRYTVTPTNISIKRVQDLTEDEAQKLGLIPYDPNLSSENVFEQYRRAFCHDWSFRYHKKYPWDSNPAVWFVEVEL